LSIKTEVSVKINLQDCSCKKPNSADETQCEKRNKFSAKMRPQNTQPKLEPTLVSYHIHSS